MAQAEPWKVCSICRTPIPYGSDYFACSVSTCRSKRTGLYFCSMPCFEAHLPEMRHRDAWAEQERAPTREQAAVVEAAEAEPREQRADVQRRRIVGVVASPVEESAQDVLVVVSKLKKYIRERSGMSTSDSVVSVLSDHLRWLSTEALRKAAADGRKTVMDRDFSAVLKELKQRAPSGS